MLIIFSLIIEMTISFPLQFTETPFILSIYREKILFPISSNSMFMKKKLTVIGTKSSLKAEDKRTFESISSWKGQKYNNSQNIGSSKNIEKKLMNKSKIESDLDILNKVQEEINKRIDEVHLKKLEVRKEQKNQLEEEERNSDYFVAGTSNSKLEPLLKETEIPIYSSEEEEKRIQKGSPLLASSSPLLAHGRHITLDYTGFYSDARKGGEIVIELMREAVHLSGMTEMHNKMVVLGEDSGSDSGKDPGKSSEGNRIKNKKTPPGFTGVVLIDESHITAHCYSDRGWLAIDVFTCGDKNPPLKLVKHLHSNLVKKFPELTLIKKITLPRFLHDDISKSNSKSSSVEHNAQDNAGDTEGSKYNQDAKGI